MSSFISSFSARRFVILLAGLILGLAGVAIAYNGWFYTHHPESPLQRSFNAQKGGYDAIIIGSSRANAYVPYFEDRNISVLNMAAAGATPYEMKRRLEHALRYSAPKTVVMGLDFFAFNTYWPGSKFFREYYYATPDIWTEVTFRLKRFFGYTMEPGHLKRNFRGKYAKDKEDTGAADDAPATLDGFIVTDQFYMQDGYNPTPYLQYSLSHDVHMRAFADIVRIAQERHIDLILITAPVHVRLLSIMHRLYLWEAMEGWKRAVMDAAGPFPVYDAMLYTPRTEVRADRPQKEYRESSHFSPAFATRMLTRIHDAPGRDGPDFKVLSPDMMDGHFAAQRAAQKQFEAAHKTLLGEIDTMYEKRREAKVLLRVGEEKWLPGPDSNPTREAR